MIEHGRSGELLFPPECIGMLIKTVVGSLTTDRGGAGVGLIGGGG